jgi:hypothetical protein
MVLDKEERPRGGGEGRPASTLSWSRGAGLGRTAGEESQATYWRSGQGQRVATTGTGRAQARGGRAKLGRAQGGASSTGETARPGRQPARRRQQHGA